jgi:hypothetical protein
MKTLKRYRRLGTTALVVLIASVAYSCKDFLVGNPQGSLDEITLTNRVGVEGTLIAAYRMLDCTNATNADWGCAASNWVWGSVTSDDAYKGSEASDQPAINDLEAYAWGTGNSEAYLNTKWRAVFEGVVRSNAAIRLLDKVVSEKPGEFSAAEVDQIRGEALFLRAHYHFEAYRVWGNIPYYRAGDTDYRKSNVGVNVTAELLVDLDSAIALLPATPRRNQVGRATTWAAQAYKGKVQMYAGDFAGALTTLRAVQASGVYALETSYDRVWTGFSAFANGPETILAFQASANDGEPNGDNANYGERLNFPHSGSPFGCCGFHQPSQNVVNAFGVDANGLPLSLSDPNWNARDANLTGADAVPVDPRLDWAVGRDAVPFKDWGLHAPGWIRSPSYGGPYSAKKNTHERASGAQSNVGWVNTQLNSVNIHIYRYADALLLLAEAEVEAGVLENARAIVNQIRARAGQTAQGCGSGFDAVSDSVLKATYPICVSDSRIAVPLVAAGTLYSLTTPWAVYRVGEYPGPWTDQAAARAAVREERKLELALEGQRFFDLRRWAIADQVINAYLAVESNRRTYLAAAQVFAARHGLFPIPNIQIELSRVGSEERLVQNPGW